MLDTSADAGVPTPRPRSPRSPAVTTLLLAPVYAALSLVILKGKLAATPAWFDGTLERNHHLLMAFDYTNNEQSRLLQFLVPEGISRVSGLSVRHAYLLQRWLWVALALILFHLYLRRWFSDGAAFAGSCFLAAVFPLTYRNDLQESAPLLMVTFLLGLWAIRADRPWWFAGALLIGALTNETTLVLPVVFFFNRLRGWRPGSLWAAGWRTVAVAVPAFVATGVIRYITRDQEHLGGAWHWGENLRGIRTELTLSPFDWYQASYLYIFFIFGALWVYAYVHFRRHDRFVRATLLMVPLFVVPNLITGIIGEVRQMLPLAFVVIPAAMMALFPDDVRRESAQPSGESDSEPPVEVVIDRVEAATRSSVSR